jgi:hypothetical protein
MLTWMWSQVPGTQLDAEPARWVLALSSVMRWVRLSSPAKAVSLSRLRVRLGRSGCVRCAWFALVGTVVIAGCSSAPDGIPVASGVRVVIDRAGPSTSDAQPDENNVRYELLAGARLTRRDLMVREVKKLEADGWRHPVVERLVWSADGHRARRVKLGDDDAKVWIDAPDGRTRVLLIPIRTVVEYEQSIPWLYSPVRMRWLPRSDGVILALRQGRTL